MASCQNVRNTVAAHSRVFLNCVRNTNDTCWLIDSLNWNLMQADLIYLLWDFWVEASLKSVGISAVLWLWVVFKMPELHKAFLLSSYVYELCLLPFINWFCIQIHVWFCLQDDFNCVSNKCSVRCLQLSKNKPAKCSIAATISVQKNNCHWGMRTQHSFSVDLKFTTNATIHFLNSADTNTKYASSLSILCLLKSWRVLNMASSMFSSDENIFWMGASENMKESNKNT